MEIVEKVAEDKQEQHANANGQLAAPNDLPYTKERLAMMSIILQRILTQTGELLLFKPVENPRGIDGFIQTWAQVENPVEWGSKVTPKPDNLDEKTIQK